jgi:hypothetical protein
MSTLPRDHDMPHYIASFEISSEARNLRSRRRQPRNGPDRWTGRENRAQHERIQPPVWVYRWGRQIQHLRHVAIQHGRRLFASGIGCVSLAR